mgnify:CR=1 FL=1
MRILVHLDNLRVGGAQHSSLDLAVALAAAGHDVVLAAGPGPLTAVADARGLHRHLLPDAPHPSRYAARALSDIVDEERSEVIVTFGPWAAMEAVTGPGWRHRVPVVAAYPSATLPPEAPRTTAVVARRRAVLDAARDRNPLVADVPAAVDATYNRPGHPDVDADAFRREHGSPGAALLVLATRLITEQKAAGIELCLRAVEVLARVRPVRLVIVGDGSQRDRFAALAGPATVFVGEQADPRAAYAAADVVLGLGTSVVRGAAFARPCIALGGDGQAVVVDDPSIAALTATGWLAPGDPVDPEGLAAMIGDLLDDPERSVGSASAGRAAVLAERDGPRVVEALVPVLDRAVAPNRVALAVDIVRSWTSWWVRLHGGRLYRRVRFRFRRFRDRVRRRAAKMTP